MRLLPWKREKALSGDSGVLDAIREQNWNAHPLLGGGARQRIQEAYATAQTAGYHWMYCNSPAIRTVVDVIVRNVGQLDLRLYEEIDEAERQPRPEHAAALSLRYPNSTTPSDRFVRSMFLDFLTFGNAYALMLPAPQGQLTLQWIPAHRIEISGPNLFDPDTYWVIRRDGLKFPFMPEAVLHWRNENPFDPRLGLSPLETLRNVIAEDAAMEAANVELAKSGMTSPSWVFRPIEAPDWTNEARQRAEEDLEARLKRSNSKPVILEESMELRDIGVSPRDAQALDVRRWTTEKIAAQYGVPLAMVDLDDNVDQARSVFYADCLPPYCESFTKTLNTLVLVRHYNEPDFCFEFNLHEKQMGDERIKTLISAAGAPIFLRNESRAMLDMPPVPDGDEIITPGNVLVGGKPSPMMMPVQDPNKPSQEGDAREGLPTPVPASDRSAEGLSKAIPGAVPAANHVWQLSNRRQVDISRQRRYVREAQVEMQKFFRAQAQAIRGKRLEFDVDHWDRQLSARVLRLVSSIVEREGGIYVARLLGDDFDMGQVGNYLKAQASGAAHGINDATRRNIADMGLEDALERTLNVRAAVAGAALGAGSTTFARQEAAKQAPQREFRLKTWVADTERHAHLDGTSVPLDQDWDGLLPGSEPNCQCSVTIE